MNINRPLSPHLTIYKPQLTSTFSILHRISGAFLATMVLFSLLFCLEIGLISFTYGNFYQFSFSVNFPKFILGLVNLTLLALCYHMSNGVRHLWWDLGFFLEFSLIIRISEFLALCVAFLALGKIIRRIYC
uniref:Succinate dehydrogenase cytochrome subunit 3 n=1 Tax=Cycas taitungensis TaxID=54799 RepID=E1CBI4_CYCTA|nr:succinate dehydrogenase cytochrome subunit 3 [Cycas taitungensis]